MRAGREELVGGRDGEDEARAHRLQVERDAVRDPQRRLHLGRHGGKGVVGRRSGDDDEVDVGGDETGVGERRDGGSRRQRRSRLAVGGDVTLANAGALHDPFVGRVDHRRHFGVADDALRQRGADAADG